MAVLIDPRQRQAAAILLSAMVMPAPMGDAAKALRFAASVCPGITAGEARVGDRKGALERVQDLVAELLAEIPE